MRKTIVLFVLALAIHGYGQDQKKPVTLRSILLEELKSTHNEKDWFVDADTAVAGLTAEQANWTDGKGNHSVGQLAYHIVFWNQRNLARLKGETLEKFSGNNDETFDKFDSKRWAETVQQLDAVMRELEKIVETADDKKLAEWAPTIAKIATHNAYHIGQIVYVRKEQGSWDASKGVK